MESCDEGHDVDAGAVNDDEERGPEQREQGRQSDQSEDGERVPFVVRNGVDRGPP
jgi:hypothetical protein